ncbi:Ribonuclease BN, tRNA processing enzyme [Amycolatopsis arida]|uniref:Ribonuclease BN, tRNA processing enzyme n=1 Tax=Amycolatopsis arida TaxID=587909 RepID=A0A1I5WV71_9PSEU|nr:MBL fold metallo-hydrolase [Amycolatopsis arida]TDX92464.1 ribonuclease BN (tRNA processing enzyme) [Amycolatopsis arida]SFQ23518.1 Ribonuclease BN, tRNA processing enzyme [Amycolatopsis arida]
MSRLHVLGSCGAWPEPGRACSGFLLDHAGVRIVLDLGYGTVSRLLQLCPDGMVDAVVVTHAHPDHCADLTALGRAWHFAEPRRTPLPLFCPPEVLAWLEPRPDPHTVFAVHDLAEPARVGPVELSGVPLPHHVPNLGVRLAAPGLTVAYTGDTGPAPELAELGRDADLFVVEATLQGPRTDRYLLTAGEAGRWAARAGARRLLPTHFWPGSDRSFSVRAAAAAFPGEVLAAADGMVVDLP